MNIEGENNNFSQCFSANHAVLRSKGKFWLSQTLDVFSNMSTRGLLLQWSSTIKIQLCVGIVQSGHHHHHHFALNYTHSLIH